MMLEDGYIRIVVGGKAYLQPIVSKGLRQYKMRYRREQLFGLCLLINTVVENGCDKKMVEIGSYMGESTTLFANAFEHVIAVDSWKRGYDTNDAASERDNIVDVEQEFDKRVIRCNKIIIGNKIGKIKTNSKNAATMFESGSLDLVYIDGCHKEWCVTEDIKTWLPKIRRNGYVSGHDYGSKKHPGVKVAIDKLFGRPDEVFSDGNWIKRIL